MNRAVLQPLVLTWIAAAAVFVVSLASIGVLPFTDSWDLLRPSSILLILPVFLLGYAGLLVLPLASVALVLWLPALRRGSVVFPVRSFVLLGAGSVLSALHFATQWRLGLEFQGVTFTRGCLVASCLLAGVVGVLGWLDRRQPSYGKNLAAHFLLFAWLVSYAFPYLGEWP